MSSVWSLDLFLELPAIIGYDSSLKDGAFTVRSLRLCRVLSLSQDLLDSHVL